MTVVAYNGSAVLVIFGPLSKWQCGGAILLPEASQSELDQSAPRPRQRCEFKPP
jgi:hypothetical protein